MRKIIRTNKYKRTPKRFNKYTFLVKKHNFTLANFKKLKLWNVRHLRASFSHYKIFL